ncbi:MAG TPA: hypothetical protein VGK00_16680 [Anaerolineales bacterium]
MNALDLTLHSIYRINGQELPLLPGLLAQNPPKKPARGRDQDRLLVYLTLAGNVSYSESEYAGIANRVAETFYSTPGSLTFALKTAAESLNTQLVDRNMKTTGKGLYSVGALVLCNLRGNSMYIVQAGPTHVYHLTGEARHLYDPLLAGKGLGLSQTAHMYFSQVTLSPGDRLLMCAALPPNWDKSISEARGSSSPENTRRRLLAITDTNVSALLVQVSEGSGVMNILSAAKDEKPFAPFSSTVPVREPFPQSQTPPISLQAAEAHVAASVPTVIEAPAVEAVSAQMVDSQAPAAEIGTLAMPESNPQPISENPQVEQPIQPLLEPKNVNQSQARDKFDQGLRGMAGSLAHSIQSLRSQMHKFSAWAGKAIPRLLPENEAEQPVKTSRTWAIFFAVAIPVLLFVVARIVYYQLGYEAQYKSYYDRAQQAVQQAQVETAPTALRVEWQAALDWLDKADQYQGSPSPESQNLRQVAQTALDNLDKVVRLGFAPAFTTPLPRNLQVVRMSASESDIYLLDAVNGSVLRGVFNSQTYDLDGSFQCSPGSYNGIRVDKLIDIFAMPRSRTNDATLLGIDNSGNLLYCIPGEAPRAAFLQMPESGWKDITSFAYDDYNLYVLDAPARAVWVYLGNEKVEFADKPYFFFEEQVPVMLEQAIGMAVNGDDLYVLHQDGHMALCTFSHIATSPTRCSDPALYIDTRPGYEGGMNLGDGIFSQITFTTPPDPSVALLEPFTQSIYRFSPRALELQNQVRAAAGKANPLPKGMAVTAMAFSPNKILFLFVNGQVYFSGNAP